MSFIINKKGANIVSLHKSLPQKSNPPKTDLEQTIKRISSCLVEGNSKGVKKLAASDDLIAPFSAPN